jgi:hypothetical protein
MKKNSIVKKEKRSNSQRHLEISLCLAQPLDSMFIYNGKKYRYKFGSLEVWKLYNIFIKWWITNKKAIDHKFMI